MSVVTKIACLGLVRDSAPELVSQANGLRKAENVVLRSPGVLETRPSFAEYYESTITPQRVRAIHEFQDNLVAIDVNPGSGAWHVERLPDGSFFADPVGATNPAEPVDYQASETKFAQARKSLYFTSHTGILKIDTVTDDQALEWAGVEMQMVTDLLTHSSNLGERGYTWAYQFVFRREDDNGYVRRSPPSERYIVSSENPLVTDMDIADGINATRVYFHRWLEAGDTVEVYRTRVQAGTAPSPDLFLAYEYELTEDDITAGYFVPPYDTTTDDELGAALYTSPTQKGAIAAKYAPPVAQALALFQSVMWYGRTASKQRAGFEVKSVNLAGVIFAPTEQVNMYTGGSDIVQVDDSSQYTIGSYWTDNFEDGPSVAGTLVPALTRILDAPTATTLQLSAGPLLAPAATGQSRSAQMYLHARSGFATAVPHDGSGGVHVSGSPYVTGVDTTDLRVGMAWTDNLSAGPAAAGTLMPADTFIEDITSSTTMTLSKNASASGTGGYGFDTVTVDGVVFTLWPGESILTARTPVWNWPVRTVPYWSNWYGFETAVDSATQVLTLVTNLCAAVNYWQLTHQSTFHVRAVPHGATNLDMRDTGVSEVVGDPAGGVTFEEVGVGRGAFLVETSRPTAIDPSPALLSTNDDRPNRLFWSDLDEPESVPLTNFVDIGSQAAPILALVPLRNALLVFKADGVWRVTGAGPSNWTVDILDPTLRLVRPEAVSTSDNRAYAWCSGGFFAVDESGAQSLSAEKIDVELRDAANLLNEHDDLKGVFVVAVQQRNLVLLGVPTSITAGKYGETQSGRVYCYNETTAGFTEWPLSASHVCESADSDRVYYTRPEEDAGTGTAEIAYEVRRMTGGMRGFDRTYEMGPSFAISGATVTVDAGDIGTWRPVVGDWISGLSGDTRYFRRITAAVFDAGTWTLTLEAVISDGGGLLITDADVFFVTDGGVFFLISDLSAWEAHEHIGLAIEWQPTAPAGLPTGAVCREMQFQLDLREAPDPAFEVSIPEYVVGGSSERDATPYTLTSNHTRTATVQPLRVGTSRQIARAATIAAYFATSDIYPFRLVGASLVHEGTSTNTRR